ncbi:hypothetical protein EW146_g9576, partial [Bondarzewia mesenterica]
MKGAPTSSWFQKGNKHSRQVHQSSSSHQPSTLSTPTPNLPRSKSTFSTFSSLHLTVSRAAQRAPSAASLHSSHSAGSTRSSSYNDNYSAAHPFAAMVSAPLPVVSSHDSSDDEEECPVCLEPLSFSFRLPGEKPHIVPECGHALHEACFTAVYGPPPGSGRTQGVPRQSNLGVCGVCRRPMKVGDGDGGKSNKLAALTGMGDRNNTAVYPGRETPSSMRSFNGRGPSAAAKPYDPKEDDPIDHAQSVKSGGSEHSQYVVAPSIQVRPEFSSLTRSHESTQALTCLVVLELPGKRGLSQVPGPVMVDSYHARNGHNPRDASSPAHSPEPSAAYRQNHQQHQYHQNFSDVSDATIRKHAQSPGLSNVASPTSISPHDRYASSLNDPDAPYSPAGISPAQATEEESPFGAITEDLRNRIIDWKGHPLAGLGPLQMFDLLSVRRDALVREFFVYLFKEALICVAEEKKRSLGRFLSTASGAASALAEGSPIPGSSSSQASKGVLRLKGRIYIRHIRQVTDTSVQGELSLTIDMEDERLDSFILIFKDRSSLETWKTNIQSLVVIVQRQMAPSAPAEPLGPLDMEEFGGSSKAARMLSGSTGTTVSVADSLLNGSSRSTMSSSTSHGSMAARQAMHPKLAPLDEDEGLSPYATSSPGLFTPHMSAGPSNSLTPLPHPPLDLILVISIPSPHTSQSTAALKVRVIKTSL